MFSISGEINGHKIVDVNSEGAENNSTRFIMAIAFGSDWAGAFTAPYGWLGEPFLCVLTLCGGHILPSVTKCQLHCSSQFYDVLYRLSLRKAVDQA